MKEQEITDKAEKMGKAQSKGTFIPPVEKGTTLPRRKARKGQRPQTLDVVPAVTASTPQDAAGFNTPPSSPAGQPPPDNLKQPTTAPDIPSPEVLTQDGDVKKDPIYV